MKIHFETEQDDAQCVLMEFLVECEENPFINMQKKYEGKHEWNPAGTSGDNTVGIFGSKLGKSCFLKRIHRRICYGVQYAKTNS